MKYYINLCVETPDDNDSDNRERAIEQTQLEFNNNELLQGLNLLLSDSIEVRGCEVMIDKPALGIKRLVVIEEGIELNPITEKLSKYILLSVILNVLHMNLRKLRVSIANQ